MIIYGTFGQWEPTLGQVRCAKNLKLRNDPARGSYSEGIPARRRPSSSFEIPAS
jgi:hypothetical protein